MTGKKVKQRRREADNNETSRYVSRSYAQLKERLRSADTPNCVPFIEWEPSQEQDRHLTRAFMCHATHHEPGVYVNEHLAAELLDDTPRELPSLGFERRVREPRDGDRACNYNEIERFLDDVLPWGWNWSPRWRLLNEIALSFANDRADEVRLANATPLVMQTYANIITPKGVMAWSHAISNDSVNEMYIEV